MKLHSVLIPIILGILIFGACNNEITQSSQNVEPQLPDTHYDYVSDMGFDEEQFVFTNEPNDNPTTNAGATLGRVLFYDEALSISNRISCGSCHQQALAFTDGLALSTGFENKLTTRNTPTILNMRFSSSFFWDMSQFSLEEQVVLPIQNHIEMGMEDMDYLVTKLKGRGYYDQLFADAFGSATITSERIGHALAQFVRTVQSNESKFDAGKEQQFANFSAIELRGMEVFQDAGCNSCHRVLGSSIFIHDGVIPPIDHFGDFYGGTGDDRANIGLDMNYVDQGAGNGMFKIPSLRNIGFTAPYMHDGRFTTLDEVLDHYQFGVKNHPELDFRMKDQSGNIKLIDMDHGEREALKAFLFTLTDEAILEDLKFSDPFVY